MWQETERWLNEPPEGHFVCTDGIHRKFEERIANLHKRIVQLEAENKALKLKARIERLKAENRILRWRCMG